MNLAYKIKELRHQKGLSQNELAEKSKLSLRTIQRIELEETAPRGYTLNSLATALDVNRAELAGTEVPNYTNSINLLNLSAISFIIFPLLSFLTPLIVWISKKNKTAYENSTANKILNFQATWVLLITVIHLGMAISKLMHVGGIFRIYFYFVSVGLLYFLNFALIMINMVRIRNSKEVFYQPAIPFFT